MAHLLDQPLPVAALLQSATVQAWFRRQQGDTSHDQAAQAAQAASELAAADLSRGAQSRTSVTCMVALAGILRKWASSCACSLLIRASQL